MKVYIGCLFFSLSLMASSEKFLKAEKSSQSITADDCVNVPTVTPVRRPGRYQKNGLLDEVLKNRKKQKNNKN
ncbi:MAG: hypothetical protein ACXWL2_03565 [Candidatus Chromulinivorax sp.]